ncbi:hypothetical protein BDQ12DRAFT_760385 [Crucibulum laeve]|uniref:Uncharacterized protein n=1 Tax=Crucibulum laeve TaxID=68775 RepID=A0A5C3LRF1_9AGAR|nr:hypothetical protein BDQ12DRAFT_760385 [Crucibulum laeve]
MLCLPALPSRTFFYSISQAHVFAVVDYMNPQPLPDDLIRAREASLKNLLAALESKPYLGQFIREFHLHIDDELKSGACVATVACILGYCRKLELFCYCDTGFPSWTDYPDALSCAVEDIFRYNSLLFLKLLNIEEFPPHLFTLCPTIKKFQLFHITVDIPMNNHYYAVAIESLEFTGLHETIIPRIVSSGFDFSPLGHLKSWLFEPEALNMLWTILDKCNHSLETLHCSLTAQYTMEYLNATTQDQNVPNHLLSPPSNFKSLTALRMLTLGLDGRVDNTFSWGFIMQHFLVKSSVAQNVTIKEMVLHVEPLHYLRDDALQNEIIIDALELERIQHTLLDRIATRLVTVGRRERGLHTTPKGKASQVEFDLTLELCVPRTSKIPESLNITIGVEEKDNLRPERGRREIVLCLQPSDLVQQVALGGSKRGIIHEL